METRDKRISAIKISMEGANALSGPTKRLLLELLTSCRLTVVMRKSRGEAIDKWKRECDQPVATETHFLLIDAEGTNRIEDVSKEISARYSDADLNRVAIMRPCMEIWFLADQSWARGHETKVPDHLESLSCTEAQSRFGKLFKKAKGRDYKKAADAANLLGQISAKRLIDTLDSFESMIGKLRRHIETDSLDK